MMGLFPKDDARHSAIYAEEAALIDASELIAAAMEARGLSRSDLARLLNVSRSEVTARLRGDRNLTVRSLASTLHALGAKLELKCDLPRQSTVPQPTDLAAYRGWRQAKPDVHESWHSTDIYPRLAQQK